MSEAEQREIVINGLAASPGVSHGPAFVLQHGEVDVPAYEVPKSQRLAETERFEAALLKTRKEVLGLRNEVGGKLGEDEAAIFDAHLLVLEDKALIDETVREIEESGLNVEASFQRVANRYIDAFLKIDDEYIKERVADIRDVTRRVIRNLMGRVHPLAGGTGDAAILVAEDITPSEAAALERNQILGLLTDGGGRTSHAVIVSRSMEIPAVVGTHNATRMIKSGDIVLVDGYSGQAIIHPTEQTLYSYGKLKLRRQTLRKVYDAEAQAEAVTRDGRAIAISANVEGDEELESIRRSGARGVGLFRTEMLFLRNRSLPDEEVQYQSYRRMVEALAPDPVVIRTLDVGGDKFAGDSLTPREDNPFMGFRAIRISLERPDLFRVQLRAILRASAHGKVKVMYPMVASASEIIRANDLLESCRRELESENVPFDPAIKIGCMLEIPSTAMTIDLLAPFCDFFSVGTNDLIQYLLAVDRGNDRVANLYDPSHPAVIRTLRAISDGARTAQRPVSVCGELAGEVLYAPMLIGLDVSELSVSPALVPELKYVIRNIDYAACKDLVQRMLSKGSSDEITALLGEFYETYVNTALQQAAK